MEGKKQDPEMLKTRREYLKASRGPYLHIEIEADIIVGGEEAQKAYLINVREEFIGWLIDKSFDVNVVTNKVRN